MTGKTQAVYAGWWRRLWAVALDVTLVAMVASAVELVTRGLWAGTVVLAFVLVYDVGLTAQGGTVGKRMVRLRVVRGDGSELGVVRGFVRELVGKPLSTVLMLGYLWPLWELRHRAWHDLIAGSVVVSELVPFDAPDWRFDPPWLAQG